MDAALAARSERDKSALTDAIEAVNRALAPRHIVPKDSRPAVPQTSRTRDVSALHSHGGEGVSRRAPGKLELRPNVRRSDSESFLPASRHFAELIRVLTVRPSTEAFDAVVAATWFENPHPIVIVTPNASYIPTPATGGQPWQTYEDGRWGGHEYSRWPQFAREGYWHLACIPRHSEGAVHDILFETLLPRSHFVSTPRAGVPDYGYLHHSVVGDLRDAAKAITGPLDKVRYAKESHREWGDQLICMLCMTLERIQRVPSTASVAIRLGAQVQRLCLELAGLLKYFEVVVPRMKSLATFKVDDLENCLGAFTYDPDMAWKLWRVGIPVWHIKPLDVNMNVQMVHELVEWHWYVRRPRDAPMGPWVPAVINGAPPQHATHQKLLLTTASELAGHRLGLPREERGSDRPGKRARVHDAAAFPRLPPQPDRDGNGISRNAQRRLRHDHAASREHRTLPTDGATTRPDHSARSDGRPSVSTLAVSSHMRPGTRGLNWQPSLVFYESAFYRVPQVWAEAMKAMGTLPDPVRASLYFYPPPFLLDTVRASQLLHGAIPVGTLKPEALREDEKSLQYLHNLVSIRKFCCLRLVDGSVGGEPLKIIEWRAALWGVYEQRDVEAPSIRPRPASPKPGAAQTSKRLRKAREDKNNIARLFGRTGQLPSYSPASAPSLGSIKVDLNAVRDDGRVRVLLLWESHEINFRAELLVLDYELGGGTQWDTLERWRHERETSEVWGEAASAEAIIPSHMEASPHLFCWPDVADSGWTRASRHLARFVRILLRWPGGCEALSRAHLNYTLWDARKYTEIQQAAVAFYVQSFVDTYGRMPIPPIAFPTHVPSP